LWLTTTQPGLVYSEMKAAYDHNCRKLWIVNVHDPKVAAYDLEFFLDMAWDINSIVPNETLLSPLTTHHSPLTINQHLERWLCTQFGEKAGKQLAPVMREFYRLCAIRKPEFMGWTQVELDKKIYPRGRSQVVDTEFSESEFGNELNRYLAAYSNISYQVSEASRWIRPELQDAYFAAVVYPVAAANEMARKMLFAQRARSRYQGQTDKGMEGRQDYMYSMAWTSMKAYRNIQKLTQQYNELAGGKWKGIMNMMPRDLNVFNPPLLPYLPTDEEVKNTKYINMVSIAHDNNFSRKDIVARNACDYQKATEGIQPIQMLGHSTNAVAIPKDGELAFTFTTEQEGDATLFTAMIPTQPNDRGDLRYQVQIDNEQPVTISLKEKFRSEFWKLSVLRGQALKQTDVKLSKGSHTLKIKALDDHIIMDQWLLDFKKGRKFYVIPAI
jgi:hypothetical protein